MMYFMFLIGVILGSFYLVIATRLPKNEDVLISRSHCDNCNEVLKWYQLIPIISYFMFLGKCPKCKKRIPIINLIVELATGFLFSYMYLKFGISYEFFVGLIVSSLVIIIFISDFKYMIILDSPLVISSVLVFILKWIYFGYIAALKALLSGLLLFSLMFLVGKFGDKVFQRESLGGGDIKFAFVMGLILGVKLALCTLVLSAFLALPVSVAVMMTTKNNEVPFGPFLVGALFIVFVFMEKFINLINLFFSL